MQMRNHNIVLYGSRERWVSFVDVNVELRHRIDARLSFTKSRAFETTGAHMATPNAIA